MKIPRHSPLLAKDWRGDPIRTVNADVAAAELDASSEESRALFRKRDARLSPPPPHSELQNRSPVELADFFAERIGADRLANDPNARAAAQLLRRRDKALKLEGQKRRVRRVKRYARWA
jgi:hypothetical protein